MKILKKFIYKIDKIIFFGIIGRIYIPLKIKKLINFKSNKFNYGYLVQYKKFNDSQINTLSEIYGSDKGGVSNSSNPYGWYSHNYADFYSLIFALKKREVKLLVECGIGTNNTSIESSMGINGKPGASLRLWREYFPNAKIIGCDIDKDILFEDERIKTYHCDQTSKSSIESFMKKTELSEKSVDIIIDDGLHEYYAGICFFENTIKYLQSDGIYLIEDITHIDMTKYKEYFLKFDKEYEARFIYMKSPKWNKYKFSDNNLICITKKK